MAIVDPGPRAAMMDQGTQAALVDLGTPWIGRQVAPPKQFPWGRPQPRGGARKALHWTEPAEKVNWAGPAETKVS